MSPNRHPLRLASFASLLILATGCARESDVMFPPGAALVEDRALSEMSGLEASPRDPGVFWSINDSGSRARLFRLDADGRSLGRVAVKGAFIRDSESLALWREKPGEREWLLIGDVGDNRGWRGEVRIHAVAEPALDIDEARIEWTLRFRYPDGPRDAEGIAVDHCHGELLILTKRDRPPRLYRVPLRAADSSEPVVAEFLATLPDEGVQGSVTGLDVSKDGRLLAVLTYRGLYVWEREAHADWRDVLQTAPRRLPLPAMRKAEAMAFDHAADAIFVGSEKRPTPFLRIPL